MQDGLAFKSFIRDSFWGQVIYRLSGRKLLVHIEEEPDYVVPEKYLPGYKAPKETEEEDQEKEKDAPASEDSSDSEGTVTPGDEYVFVEFEQDDPEDPHNWPLPLKVFFILEVAFLTTSVYMGSAIFTPGITEIKEKFQVNNTIATLPLSMFVIGYGIGPMVFSPMSEHPSFGRMPIYIGTLFLFFILQIPTALVENIAGLCVLRLIAGFFASPALATGGASIMDVLSIPYAPVGIAAWSMAAVCGPSLGPLIGSAMTVAGGWRWTFWFMAIISGTTLLFLSFLFPETYGKTILLRRAQRLRAKTGNQNLTTPEEVANKTLTFSQVASDTLWRPIKISISEPVVILINMYITLVYSILYLWFEAFPLVFQGVYHFTLVEEGVSYVSIMIGIVLGCAGYLTWVYKKFTLRILNHGFEGIVPELFVPAAIIGAVLMPVGVFLFGWTAAPDIHWIVPMIGAAIFACGAFFIFQTLFNYLGMSFQRYVASVFAGNALFRSVIAGCFPLFGHPLFYNLKTSRFVTGWGCTILGLISVAMIAIPVLFHLNGPKLRARSPYAG